MTYVYMVLRWEDSKTLGADVAPKGSPIYVGITDKPSRLKLYERGTLTFDQHQIHVYHETDTREEAAQMEQDLICQYGRLDLGTGMLRNLTDGGEGVTGPKSAEHKAAIGDAIRGRDCTWGDKLSVALKGRKVSDETKATISTSMKARYEAGYQAPSIKTYLVKPPDGEWMEVTNLAAFCRDKGLNNICMHAVIAGRNKHHRGWLAKHID